MTDRDAVLEEELIAEGVAFRAHTGILLNTWDHLPTVEYVAAMGRVQKLIADGAPLRIEPDTDTASWGMCTQARTVWPDKRLHIWPDQFLRCGRVAPLNRNGFCPFDRRAEGQSTSQPGYGCYYTCMIFKPDGRFQSNGRPRVPNREEALDLYRIGISRETKRPDTPNDAKARHAELEALLSKARG